MADETRDASVRLTADVSPYTQSVRDAGAETARFSAQIDTLSAKMDGLAKRAGQKLLLFAGGGAAGIASATAAAASMEKQMSTLAATASITDKSFEGYTKTVHGLTKEFPIARQEAIALVQTIDKLGITTTKQIGEIAKTMTQLHEATGEGLGGLTTGLIELGRQMGTINAGSMNQFANALLTVSTNAGVSAQAVTSFAQAIAPAARMAGISETAVLGISGAFAKAGAEGYAAANTFSSMINDITRQAQSGSPEIAKYANLIGKTSQQFKNMDRGEAITEIFESLNKQGPNAIKTLDRLGYDGPRALRSIQAVAQAGGLRQGIAEALGADPDNLNKASGAADKGLYDQLTKTRSAMTDIADTAGKPFLGVFTPIVRVLNDMLRVLNALEEPLAHLGAKLSGVATLAAGGLGLALVTARLRNMALLGAAVGRSQFVGATRSGFAVGRGMASGQTVVNDYSRMAADGSMRWWQRPFYTAAQGLGQGMGPGMGPGFAGRILSSPIRLATSFIDAQTGFVQDARLPGLQRQGMGVLDAIGRGASGIRRAFQDPQAFVNHLTGVAPAQMTSTQYGPFATGLSQQVLHGPYAAGLTIPATSPTNSPISQAAAAGQQRAAAAMARVAAAAQTLAAVKKEESGVSRQLIGATGGLVKAFIRLEAQSAVSGLAIAGNTGLGLMKGAGKGALGLVGGPWGAAILGGFAGLGMYRNWREGQHEDYSNGYTTSDKYSVALGRATDSLGTFTAAVKSATNALPKPANEGDLRTVTGAVSTLAHTPGRQLVNGDIKRYSTISQAAAFLQSRSMDPQQLQLAQADLAQQYGDRFAQQATDQYFKNGGSKGTPDYAALIRAGIGKEGAGFRGSIKRGLGIGITDTSKTMFAQPIVDIQGTQGQNQQRYNPQYAAAVAQNQIIDYLTATSQTGYKGYDKDEKVAQARTAIINAYENKYLGKQRIGFNAQTAAGDLEGMSVEDQRVYWSNLLLKGDKRGLITDQGISGQYASPQELAQLRQNKDTPQTTAIKQLGALGQTALTNTQVQGGIANNGDANAVGRGWMALLNSASKMSGTFNGTNASLDKLKAAINDTSDPLYQMADAARQFNNAARQSSMMYQSRAGQYGAAVSNYRSTVATARANPSDPGNTQRLTDATTELQGQQQSVYNWVKGVTQAVHDYGIQVERMDHDYYLNRKRQFAQFALSMQNAQDDFHLSRLRAEKAYTLNLKRQAEDQAASIYDPMKRMYAEYTTDAGTMLQNLQDQNARIAEQTGNLKKAKGLGLSQQAIDTLKLSDPSQAQNLQRIIGDLTADPTMVAAINAQVATRLTQTTALMQAPWNKDFRRAQADFKLSGDQATNDYERMTKRSTAAFELAMSQMAKDYKTQGNRAKQDLNNMADEIYGDLGSVMAQGIDLIGSKLGTAGGKLTKAFNDIKKNAPELFMTPQQLLSSGLTVTVTASATSAAGPIDPLTSTKGNKSTSPNPTTDLFTPYLPTTPKPKPAPKVAPTGPERVPKPIVADMKTIPSGVTYRGTEGGTQIDASTNYTGQITVQASDPDEMNRKLQEKQRLARLTSPVRR